ncbi:MAG TPA: hypothetical protein VM452_12915, partial [Caulifigura sp.]|nr:hypothetical protein [Caulifigura sp.]
MSDDNPDVPVSSTLHSVAIASTLAAALLHGVVAEAQQRQTHDRVTSKTGMVVSVSGPASDVGAAVLKEGGNAVDAAIATAFA